MKAHDITESFTIPSGNDIIEHLFEDIGYKVRYTTKTSIFEQAINIFGGIDNIDKIANKRIYDLISKLSPAVRSNHIAKQIIEKHPSMNDDDVISVIDDIRNRGAINFPAVIKTVDELIAMCDFKKHESQERLNVINTLQLLSDRRILLRGKHFSCPHCSANVWIPIENISRINYCNECSNEIAIPVFAKQKESSDHFRLNELLSRAVDQGQLATLLLANFLNHRRYAGYLLKSNIEVMTGEKLISDIDLFVKLFRRIGIAECKSFSGFTSEQIDSTITIATKLQCDFVIFSTLVGKKDKAVIEVENRLKEKSLAYPAFIITGDTLFNPEDVSFNKYFERRGNKFATGPYVI